MVDASISHIREIIPDHLVPVWILVAWGSGNALGSREEVLAHPEKEKPCSANFGLALR